MGSISRFLLRTKNRLLGLEQMHIHGLFCTFRILLFQRVYNPDMCSQGCRAPCLALKSARPAFVPHTAESLEHLDNNRILSGPCNRKMEGRVQIGVLFSGHDSSLLVKNQ
jgi:hypothetical protein